MNPLLKQTEAAILQKADPRLVPVIKKIVEVGLNVMTNDKTRGMFVKQMAGGATPEAIGAGVAKLMGILMSQKKGAIPPEVMVKAATILLCDGLDMLETAGVVKVDNAFLAACTKEMGSAILQLVGATPEQLGPLLAKQGQQGAQPEQPPAQPTGIIQGAA